jgi:hypothetical protein
MLKILHSRTAKNIFHVWKANQALCVLEVTFEWFPLHLNAYSDATLILPPKYMYKNTVIQYICTDALQGRVIYTNTLLYGTNGVIFFLSTTAQLHATHRKGGRRRKRHPTSTRE